MCYQQVFKSPSLKAKAALLKRRAHGICSEMNEQWWTRVVDAQERITDHWEVHYSDSHRGKAYWCNWLTQEKRWEKPPGTSASAMM
jgi:hypothetical protein